MGGPVESAWYRVENGTVCQFDLPLKPMFVARATSGVWQRVNPDGTPWRPEPTAAAPAPARPGRGDQKAAWVGYAIRVGGMGQDEAEAMTRHDLIDRFGGH